jgi:hypothetical protein
MTQHASLDQTNIRLKLQKKNRARKIATLLWSIFILLVFISFNINFIDSLTGIRNAIPLISLDGFQVILFLFSLLFLLGSLYELRLSRHFSLTINEDILNLLIKTINEVQQIVQNPKKSKRRIAIKTIKKIFLLTLKPNPSNPLKLDGTPQQPDAQLIELGKNSGKLINILQTDDITRIQRALKLIKDIEHAFISGTPSTADLEVFNIILDSYPEPIEYKDTSKFQEVIDPFQHIHYLADICYFIFVITICYISFTVAVNWFSIPIGNAYGAIITLLIFFLTFYLNQKLKNKS